MGHKEGGSRHGSKPAAGSAGRHWLTIVAVGDTMLGNTPELPPDPAAYLDQVKPELKGDFVSGNLEGTLTKSPDRRSAPK